jgi:predicted nucleic acid-binding protein
MINYLIDSNIISYLADKESPYNQTVVNHFCALDDDSVVSVSILTLYELYYITALSVQRE